MKIVQFRDGKFGLRRWELFSLTYRFHNIEFVDHWHEIHPNTDERLYKFTELSDVIEIHKKILINKKKFKKDFGVPIKGQDQV